MSALSNSIKLLPSLSYQYGFGRTTVVAGSFLGFGPRFFGPPCSDHNSSFLILPEDIIFPGDNAPLDGGVEVMAILLPGAGKGQSFPEP